MTVIKRGSWRMALATTTALALLAFLPAVPAAARPARATAPVPTPIVYDWAWENPLPQGSALTAVSCITATWCKAVGGFGTTLSWNGNRWTRDVVGTAATLHDVSCATTTFCKAVGDAGTIISWNGARWIRDSSPTPNAFVGVSCEHGRVRLHRAENQRPDGGPRD